MTICDFWNSCLWVFWKLWCGLTLEYYFRFQKFWRLLFARACLMGKVSFFLLWLWGPGALAGLGLVVVWHWPLQGESCVAKSQGKRLSGTDYEGHLSGQQKAPVHCQTSQHIKVNCSQINVHDIHLYVWTHKTCTSSTYKYWGSK